MPVAVVSSTFKHGRRFHAFAYHANGVDGRWAAGLTDKNHRLGRIAMPDNQARPSGESAKVVRERN